MMSKYFYFTKKKLSFNDQSSVLLLITSTSEI